MPESVFGLPARRHIENVPDNAFYLFTKASNGDRMVPHPYILAASRPDTVFRTPFAFVAAEERARQSFHGLPVLRMHSPSPPFQLLGPLLWEDPEHRRKTVGPGHRFRRWKVFVDLAAQSPSRKPEAFFAPA